MYDVFKRLIDEKGIKTSVVARETGISPTTFSEWKSGRSHPKQDKIKRIADFLGVSEEYLYTGITDKEISERAEAFEALIDYVDDLHEQIVKEMLKMDNVQLEMMLKYAKFINSENN